MDPFQGPNAGSVVHQDEKRARPAPLHGDGIPSHDARDDARSAGDFVEPTGDRTKAAMSEAAQALREWGNFFIITGSSAGALIGLQFVVLTLPLIAYGTLVPAGLILQRDT